jgi:phosphotriesterase-related protein
MPTVETVRGPVDTATLGRTYMHEHIFVLSADVQQNYPDEWGDEEDRVEDAVAKLSALAASGVRTIVDPTVIGLGRYIPRIQRVADRVPDLNIVVATGCYTYQDLPFYFHHRTPAVRSLLGRDEPEVMVPMFVGDITEGIAGTGVRAGMLKCAIDEPGLTPGVERVMRAVARSHLVTGCPITVHTHPGTHQGLTVQRVMAEEGVDPGRVVLGHSGDSTDADHLSVLAEAGFWLGMDRFGLTLGTSFEDRADIVVELCRRGFADRLVLAHDAACYIDWVDPGALELMPQWHYLHIEQDVLPYLRGHGVTEDQITAMLVGNPRRIFDGG